jgi:hypothetical protein
MYDDDDLPPAGLDLAGYFRVLAARLGRVPTLGEVAVFRHDVCAERVRRIRRRRAARKAAKGRVPAVRGNRGGEEADAVKEFFTSFEWACAMSLMLSLVVSLAELGSLRVQGRRITMRQSDLVASPHRVPDAVPVEEPARPLGSHTPDALMEEFKATHAHRDAIVVSLFGDVLYPRALASLLRSAGAAQQKCEGRDAWEVVETTDPAVGRYLRTLGTDPANWGALKIQVGKARAKAQDAARAAANPAPGEEGRGADYIDRMMQLSTAAGAAAYCAWKYWRKLGEEAVMEEVVKSIDFDALNKDDEEEDTADVTPPVA